MQAEMLPSGQADNQTYKKLFEWLGKEGTN